MSWEERVKKLEERSLAIYGKPLFCCPYCYDEEFVSHIGDGIFVCGCCGFEFQVADKSLKIVEKDLEANKT